MGWRTERGPCLGSPDNDRKRLVTNDQRNAAGWRGGGGVVGVVYGVRCVQQFV
jgi:hypothetical protein